MAAGIVALPRLQNELRWSISIAVLYTIAWFFRAQYLRYLLPILPLAALIAAVAVSRALESLHSAPRRAALTAIGCLLVCPSLVIWFASCFNIPSASPSRSFSALSQETRSVSGSCRSTLRSEPLDRPALPRPAVS